MRLLLTGASGFVGKNLCAYLGEKHQIVRFNRAQEFNVKEDCVVHLAGKAHDLRKSSSPEEYYQVNYELTKNLYDAFLKSDARKFIFVSSVKAAADTSEGILTEDIDPNPKTDYGKSKLLAEKYIQDQPLPKEKSYYILRPCMIHGPGNKGNLNLLYKFVQKNIPYPLAAFDNKRSFLSVENLCFVIESIMRNNIVSGIYNVADDDALSTNQVVSILARSLQKKPILWRISTRFIKVLAKIGDQIKLPINSERLTKLTESYVVSNAKIKNALRVKLPLGAEQGLIITADSFKKHRS
jgi:nucleoside-diphosphate-sugar epimerase